MVFPRGTSSPWTISLVLSVIILSLFVTLSSSAESEEKSEKERLDKILLEYDLEKTKMYREFFCRNQEKVNKHLQYKRICANFNRHYNKFFLSLFIIVAIGALLRTLGRLLGINLPYTVVLMILGMIFGFISWDPDSCSNWSKYTRISRLPPKIILNVFLPALIFDSAYGMQAHVFWKSSLSIFILAFPGMVFCTFVSAAVCYQFFFSYKWDFQVAALYGSIISATDPVAVVAILKELGTSEMLSTMIEGESLLNDGTAILFYEIFIQILEGGEGGTSGLHIFVMFCRIAIGGPFFGLLTAKLAIWFLSKIFNDPAVEVSITLVVAYLTYFIGEEYLGVSGVMAVVACGIMMSAERTCISPEVQGLVKHFWEMLGYLGNTVLFFLVGILISETAVLHISLQDGYYLLLLYLALNMIRFAMVFALSPILSHIGYGLSWQNMLVISWGGLRGAVSICLALDVFKNRELCERTEIGPKFLLQTAGIVLLTLLVNGTTTKGLLNVLKLTELSFGKIQDMNNAVRQIQATQARTISQLKHDRLLADCNFDIVEDYTKIQNPYTRFKVKSKKANTELDLEQSPSILVDHHGIAVCPDCEGEVEMQPSLEEYKEMTEESRLRLLKAMKVSCWRQYEQGVLTDEAVRIIIDYIDSCEDTHFKMFHSVDLKKFWTVRGCTAWMTEKVVPFAMKDSEEEDVVIPPKNRCRLCIFSIITWELFDGFIQFCVLLNMIPIIWETVWIATNHCFEPGHVFAFLIANFAFLGIFTIEFILKLIGLGCSQYWASKWNILDAIVLIISWIEVGISIFFFGHHGQTTCHNFGEETEYLKFVRFIRILRIIRIVRLCRPVVPNLANYLNSKMNKSLFFGYDVAKGSATAIDDVLKFLPQMIENTKVRARFKVVLEEQRLILLLEMGLIEKDHPGISIAIKTRHANRAVLNQLRNCLKEILEDGLIDEKEHGVLLLQIENKMKRLWHTPSYMTPRRPETLVADLQWVGGNPEVLEYLLNQAIVVNFGVGDTIYSAGDPPTGIFIIVSGIVKVVYEPNYDVIKARESFGIIPNADVYCETTFDVQMTDYYNNGAVLGELGVLEGNPKSSTATCETGVTTYFLTQESMLEALSIFDDRYNSLEGRLWRTFGMVMASDVLPLEPAYQASTVDRIKALVEVSCVPIGERYLTMTFPGFVKDAVLVYGQVVDDDNRSNIYTAPCLLPPTVKKIRPVDNYKVTPRVLIIAAEHFEHEADEGADHGPPSPSSTELKEYMRIASKASTAEENLLSKIDKKDDTGENNKKPDSGQSEV